MYDRKSEPNEFVGDSKDEAIAQATRFYEVEESDLKIVVPEDVSGAAGRFVVVAGPVGFKPSTGGGGRDDRGGSGGRSDRSDRGRGRSRDRDSGRRGRNEPRAEAPSAPKEQPAKPSKGNAKGELAPVGEFILGAVERLGMGNFDIEQESEEGSDFLVYKISGEACEGLGGGDGRATDAVQLLANQVLRLADDTSSRVVIEVEGKSAARAESLEKLADRAADRAVESGRALALDAMNGRDRRVVHLALKEREGVATMGIGEGQYRQVLIVPEGADEYDEAVASSQSSS
jgi:spoIIIJ-associated protein